MSPFKIDEMLRVCEEVRIFPLLTLELEPSPYLDSVVENLTARGYRCDIQVVAYAFQRNGNKMLKLTR